MPIKLRTLLLFILLGLITVSFYLHLVKYGPEQAFREGEGDLKKVAALTASHYPPTQDCHLITPPEQRALVYAFHSVEQLAQGPFEPFIEHSIVWVSDKLNLRSPDWSLGRGQVRISSALKSEPPSQNPSSNKKWNHTALMLLKPCINERATRRLLSYYAAKEGIEFLKPLSRENITRLAKLYNGQSVDDHKEKQKSLGENRLAAHISGEIYSHLLYALYIHYRFEQLNPKTQNKGGANAGS